MIEHMFARIVVIVALARTCRRLERRRSVGAGHEQIYLVQAGDTLWSIAASHYGGDPREAVWRLQDRNHLPARSCTRASGCVLP